MLRLTINNLKIMLAREDWQHEQRHEITGLNQETGEICGWVLLVSTLAEIEVRCIECFSAILDADANPVFQYQEKNWVTKGAHLYGSDDYPILTQDVSYLFPPAFSTMTYDFLGKE
ncbi:hypothetical protein D3C87_764730 [compost metagenome]